ncbi:MAG: sodium:calcium antiporter [Candidatus Dormibacteria bacterium]
MPVVVSAPLFVVAACVSLGTSWLLVSRLERVGERLGLSEALLGMVAALAADAPEVTSAITALLHHEQRVGAGVILGSNVFNIAALLGLSALVAGSIRFRRRVVILGGLIAIWIAAVCLVAVLGVIPPAAGLALAGAALLGYVALLGADRGVLRRLAGRHGWAHWLRAAVVEEERDLEAAIRVPRAGRGDVLVAVLSLLVVVAASVTMERTASDLGVRLGISEIVVGALVLAAVTSLPNAVGAVYLALRGRGAAVLSIALNSNGLNVVVGLLLPGTVVGLGAASGPTVLVAAWCLGLTAVSLAAAHRQRGLRRAAGGLIVAAYAVFVGWLLLAAG